MNYHPDLFMTAIKMLTALGIILGGLLILFYFIRRKFKGEVPGSKGKLIKVLGNSYIGVKKYISLVEVPGEILVLGITSDNICLLTKIEDKHILDEFKTFEGEKMWPSFSEQLSRISSRLKDT